MSTVTPGRWQGPWPGEVTVERVRGVPGEITRYAVRLDGTPIGYVASAPYTWERRTRGRRYVNDRGVAKRPKWRAYAPDGKPCARGQASRGWAIELLVSEATRNGG